MSPKNRDQVNNILSPKNSTNLSKSLAFDSKLDNSTFENKIKFMEMK